LARTKKVINIKATIMKILKIVYIIFMLCLWYIIIVQTIVNNQMNTSLDYYLKMDKVNGDRYWEKAERTIMYLPKFLRP
jgi:hypothetical protein